MKKILIVEDQADIREVIRITLELEDFELHEAANGDEGLRLASQLRPDLVLSDVMMPGMNGLQLCQRIKGDPSLKRTKVVLLSARGQPEDRKAGNAAGADAYLAKPYGPLELLATVKRMIG
jgi:CheY-like chemotaxis protein